MVKIPTFLKISSFRIYIFLSLSKRTDGCWAGERGGKVFVFDENFEEIEEYFYEDIVGVISDQEIQKLTVGEGFLRLFPRTIRYQKECITIDTKGMPRSHSYLLDMGESLLDTKFLGMRNLIRQKKNEQ